MRALKTAALLLIIVLLPMMLWATAAPGQMKSAFTRDITNTVKVSVPEKWVVESPSGLNRLLLTCPENDANILMLSQKVGTASLAQCVSAWLKNISKINGYKLVSKQNGKLAGIPGKAFTFVTSVKSAETPTTLKYVQMLTVKDKTLYAFQFACRESEFKTCAPAFDSVVASLKWLR